MVRSSRLVGVAAALALLPRVADPCTLSHAAASPPAMVAKAAAYTIGPGVSGSWYDAARDGEGLIVQYLADGQVLAVWFTYPGAGEDAEQAWLIMQGRIDGARVVFDDVLQPKGGVFGDAFDPAAIRRERWGSAELEFTDCGRLTLRYTGPAAYGSGTREYTRLTTLDELACDGTRALTTSGARAASALRAKSGAWYVASRSGEGWLVEELPNGRSVVYWFTFDPQGRQAWTVGAGTRTGDRIVVEDAVTTRGTRFGSGFSAAQVERVPWGRIEFAFSGCDAAAASYASPRAGYGSGARNAVRLTSLGSAVCLDAITAPPAGGTWTERARMPDPPSSEHAVAVLDGKAYVLGGFGDPRGFKRYDPATDSWTELPDMPAGRDHLAAFAIEGGVYFSGGAPNGPGATGEPAYRYDVAAGRWDPVPELGWNFGSHAAVLNGRAYVGDESGDLKEFDPRTRRLRPIPKTDNVPRDHSQVVAYLGEIWMLGGRTPETNRVSIYDPVADRWRRGPAFARVRGGFAAAVVGPHVVIGGGEIIFGTPLRTERSVEVYTAGQETWTMAPELPVAVHGVAAGTLGGRWYVFSGATQAATTGGTTGRTFALELR